MTKKARTYNGEKIDSSISSAGARGCRMGRDVGPWLRERCTAGRVCRTLLPRLQTRLFSPQLEVDLLKAENDRLKVAPGPSAGSAPGQIPGSSALPSPRRSLGLALTHSFSPSLTDTGTCWGEGPGRVKSRKGSPSLTPAQLPGSEDPPSLTLAQLPDGI